MPNVIRSPVAAVARGVCSAAALVMLACSGTEKPVEERTRMDASTAAMNKPGKSGGSGGVPGGGTTHPMRDAGACMQGVEPDDEFGGTCRPLSMDAGARDGGMIDAQSPDGGTGSDAGVLDASTLLDAGHDAGPPATADEGFCAMRQDQCSFGRAATTIGTASCTISGGSLQVQRQICEKCGRDTVLGDYLLMVMGCNRECTLLYSEGRGLVADPIAANECFDTTDFATLTGGNADAELCIDVYAYVGSGNTNFGWMLEASDQVRVCRCDRTTDTCISCANHACD
jgi:hypothetical protein